MLEYLVLIILILIIIFIVYTYYYLKEKDIELLETTTKTLIKNRNDKMASFYSEYLQIDKDKVYVIYYDLPLNSIYWTIGIYDNGKCLNSVNMGKYQTTEKGDTLAIIVSNNVNAMLAAKVTTKKIHESKYIYKKLITHPIYTDSDFYIKFESFSNKFHHSPKLFVKEYKFKDLPYEPGVNYYLKQSNVRKCENINFFEKVKEKAINERCDQVKVFCDTNENDNSFECLSNRSEIIDISKEIFKDGKRIPPFRIIAVDHFKSRASLHSHLIFFNADNDQKFDVEITGEISDVINHNQMITCRSIKFIPPEEIKRIYVIEYIYYDFETGSKVNPETIIPMEVYRVL